MPALSSAKVKVQGLACLNGNRQLMLAWRQYVEENGDWLPFAREIEPQSAPNAWVHGIETLGEPTAQWNWDPETTLKTGMIWPYCGNNLSIWHCPGDQSLGQPPTGPKVPRPRSRSVNGWVGGDMEVAQNGYKWQGLNGTWKVFRKLTEMLKVIRRPARSAAPNPEGAAPTISAKSNAARPVRCLRLEVSN